MARTMEMFEKPRKQRQWLMHVIDCGNGNCGELEDGEQFVFLKCDRCGHESGWITLPSVTAAKRGMPCPKCNGIDPLPNPLPPAGEGANVKGINHV